MRYQPITSALVAKRKKALVVGESFLFEEERLQILEHQQRIRNSAMDKSLQIAKEEKQRQFAHELRRMGRPPMAGMGPEGPRVPKQRLIHLDLKGAPPKISFLKQLLPMLRDLGATGFLIEYEDMFPFEGNIRNLSAKNAYHPEELKEFLQLCAVHDFSIMPLVQTFGHLEYALKLEEFSSMREVPNSPQSICPSQKDSIHFLQELLTQVIEFHLQLVNDEAIGLKMTHIHIGCDEVFHKVQCSLCITKDRDKLFLDHVINLAHFIRNKWPQLKVIIWDDMLRNMAAKTLQLSEIGNYVEPMIWVYVPDINEHIVPRLWELYSFIFPTVWAASAFKGAFGETLMLPPILSHLENNLNWLHVMHAMGEEFSKGFQGLVLTGWQRYNHFATLCELLPTGIPSLMTSLAAVSRGYVDENDLYKALNCTYRSEGRSTPPSYKMNAYYKDYSFYHDLFTTCTYVGSEFFKFALQLQDELIRAQAFLNKERDKGAWMSDYNVRHNFTSVLNIEYLLNGTFANIDKLRSMARNTQYLLENIYDEFTIAEFIEQNIYPTISALEQFRKDAERLSKIQFWPQRPLPISRALYDLDLINPNNKQQQPSSS